MLDIRSFELGIISLIQNYRTIVGDTFFKSLSLLGEELFFIIALPIIWQIRDQKFAYKFSITLLLSALFNFFIKEALQLPRPFILDSTIDVYKHVESYSFPSGHAQLAPIFWGIIAYKLNNKFFNYFATILVCLISFSRIYLAVHFPTDVIAGLLIGLMILIIYIKYIDQIAIIKNKKFLCSSIFLSIIFLIFAVHTHSHLFCITLAAVSGIMIGFSTDFKAVSINGFTNFLSIIASVFVTLFIYYGFKYLPFYHEYHFAYSYIKFFFIGIWISMSKNLITQILLIKN
ncbi:MAG: phosphatase PAP2 family protein [Alphaproteobacteria bacterium]